MLITFSCPAYANITMFGDAAVRLLKLMGHSDTVPGALLAPDVQAALERLEAAVEADKNRRNRSRKRLREARMTSLPSVFRTGPCLCSNCSRLRRRQNAM